MNWILQKLLFLQYCYYSHSSDIGDHMHHINNVDDGPLKTCIVQANFFHAFFSVLRIFYHFKRHGKTRSLSFWYWQELGSSIARFLQGELSENLFFGWEDW